MKTTLFSAVLLLSVISLPALAVTDTSTTKELTRNEHPLKKINLNSASAQILAKSFKGIGQKRAEAIVSYREAHGPFKSIEDLSAVHGLGKAFVTSHLAALQNVFVVG